jgi:hypothetical protein
MRTKNARKPLIKPQRNHATIPYNENNPEKMDQGSFFACIYDFSVK